MTTAVGGHQENHRPASVTADQSAVDRGENEGMITRSRDPIAPDASTTKADPASDRVADDRSALTPVAYQGGRSRHLPVEDTDLERRVLAHERILQALIAHMAESEPRFVDRLRATFGNSEQLRRSEHDYVDTESYAEQFIKEVTRLGSTLGRVAPDARTPVRPAERPGTAGSVDAPNSARKRDSFEVSIRAGVWKVNKNGRFFGDFLSRADAQRTINAALPGSAAEGRIVTVSWPEDQDKGP